MQEEKPEEAHSRRKKLRKLKILIWIAKGIYAVVRLIEKLLNQ